mgnify:FL=1
MIMVVLLLKYEAMHLYMSHQPDFVNIIEAVGLVSICMGALTGALISGCIKRLRLTEA